MADLRRRDFLKVVGISGTAAAAGCSEESARTLIPYIIPPEDVVPGRATWYATTCRECPAGCGLLAKNRDGRVIKVEGNPLHPVNQGRLCPRGQASVQGLYNPERLKGPVRRGAKGQWDPISWEEGDALLSGGLTAVLDKGRGERIVFLTDLVTGTLKDLVDLWLAALGSKTHILYEPYAYETLRKANRVVFGLDTIPTYRLDQADFLISFGADFLETWLSNVQYARQFASFRSPGNALVDPSLRPSPAEGRGGVSSGEKGKGFFVYVGPRLSLTAANADHWLCVPAGSEYLVALGIMRVILDENLLPETPPAQMATLGAAVNEWSLDAIETRTGVTKEKLRSMARRFALAKRPLALAGGVATSGPNGLETAVAANLLCTIVPGSRAALDWENPSSLGGLAPAQEMKELAERMNRGEVEVLLIDRANPVFSLPPAWEFARAIEKVPLVVSFSSVLDETSQFAHLNLPTHTPLEAWGDHSPRKGVLGLMQPVMGPVFRTRHLGDILLSTGRRVKGAERFPWKGFYELLRDSWSRKGGEMALEAPPKTFWEEALKRGGVWESEGPGAPERSFHPVDFSFPGPDASGARQQGELHLVTYPTIQFFDGRGANRPWLQELPDPMTQITWGNWVEIHPEVAERLGIQKGDMLYIESPHGTLAIPAYPYQGVHSQCLAMPIGQGHTAYGLFADGQPGNPMALLSPQLGASGGILWSVSGVTIQKPGQVLPLANTDGSLYQHGRGIAQAVDVENHDQAVREGQRPHLRIPLPEGYDLKEDFYPPHQHVDYRWAMVVDLDRCIGCGACAVACNAENNVAIVGKNQILKGRHMAWLTVQRYFEEDDPRVRFIPILCQHCDNAPCESVCPVFAPHHSPEGINNQIFNRCIGTRYCSQNCPYKVRRFNWFTFTRPEPLNWQLNPDVTVRQKGVMEKCSFCVQRIKEVKNRARNEGRKVRDGEVTPACVQTCPAGVFAFGSLMDPESRVSKLVQSPRAYQVLGNLNTKPAVIYLKRVTQKLKA